MADYLIFLYFFAYAFLGWLCESIYVSIGRKKLINSGFLHLPICPIYGFGALIVVYLLHPFINNPALILIYGMIATSLLEYITSWLMEVCFHIRWWDYSHKKWNINGRICLLNSTLFGIMSIAVMYIIHPFSSSIIDKLSTNAQLLLACILFVIMIIDVVISTWNTLNLNKAMEKLHQAQELQKGKLIENIDVLTKKIQKRQNQLKKKFPTNVHRQFKFSKEHIEKILEKQKRK